jgi:nucleotide-binding universal stress UspA family protein
MYRTLHVPVDNSDHSNAAIDLALGLGKAFGASLVGSHVYAAKLHDVRFKQMEFTLPDEYKEEEELEKQRKIHDALIARGLHLISDSYLDQMEVRCTEQGLAFERRHFDGRNFEALVNDLRSAPCDLVVLGALGMGAVKDSLVGSVCERVLRRTSGDTLVVRDLETTPATPGRIAATLDGSPAAWGGVAAGLALAKALGREIEIVAVADEARREDALLESHLRVAEDLARREGVTATTTLLSGGVRPALSTHLAAQRPWLVVAGRTGLDGVVGGEPGSTAEFLVRQAPCNVLLAGRTMDPAAALSAHAAA